MQLHWILLLFLLACLFFQSSKIHLTHKIGYRSNQREPFLPSVSVLGCRLTAGLHGRIIYKPSLYIVSGSEILSLAFHLRVVLHFWGGASLQGCFAFHSSLRPFTTITFAVINFAAVHTDRCNCYARHRLHLLKLPTYSTGLFDVSVLSLNQKFVLYS